jgi:hypothetical protein
MESTSLYFKYCKEVNKQRQKKQLKFNSSEVERRLKEGGSETICSLNLNDSGLNYANFRPLVRILLSIKTDDLTDIDLSENVFFDDRCIDHIVKLLKSTP